MILATAVKCGSQFSFYILVIFNKKRINRKH